MSVRIKHITTTTTIRETANYQLYRGYGATADRYWILRKISKINTQAAISNGFLELQKEELLSLTDEDFDIACSKFDYS